MSVSLVWMGVQGLEPEAFLERAGFEDTGEPDEYFEAEHSGGDLADVWYVLVSEQANMLEAGKLALLSKGARLVAVVVDETSMTSFATEWTDGKSVWSVFYDGDAEEPVLEVEGALPEMFEAIRAELEAEQAQDDEVDVVFEVPLQLAEEITGFRHDALGFDEDLPVFTALEKLMAAG